MSSAITPEEAMFKCHAVTGAHIPSFVIETVNELLVEKLGQQGSATLLKNEVVARIIKSHGFKAEFPDLDPMAAKNKLFDMKWLDFEAVFKNAGWNVKVDWPAYNETYEGRWIFKAK